MKAHVDLWKAVLKSGMGITKVSNPHPVGEEMLHKKEELDWLVQSHSVPCKTDSLSAMSWHHDIKAIAAIPGDWIIAMACSCGIESCTLLNLACWSTKSLQ